MLRNSNSAKLSLHFYRIFQPDKLLSELFDAEESEEEKSQASDDEEGKGDSGNGSGESDEEQRELSAALKKRLLKVQLIDLLRKELL